MNDYFTFIPNHYTLNPPQPQLNNRSTYSIWLIKLNHDHLIEKLKCMRFSDSSINLLVDYLWKRQQYIKNNGVKSNYSSLLRGVLKGSILGPLLFKLYVNGVFNANLFSDLVINADDAILVYLADTFND